MCADCVVECDGLGASASVGEGLVHIGTYVQWLENATPPSPTCALSSEPLDATTPTIRLANMRLYALAALDAYARQIPAHSPMAAYVLPTAVRASSVSLLGHRMLLLMPLPSL